MSGQNHLARHSERGKKTRQTKEEVGRQDQEMNRPGARQVPEGSVERGEMEKTGCKIICGSPTTLAVKGSMMIIMVMFSSSASTVSRWRHKLLTPRNVKAQEKKKIYWVDHQLFSRKTFCSGRRG